jgi:hypothetical protein
MEILTKHELFEGWKLSEVREIFLNTEKKSYV